VGRSHFHGPRRLEKNNKKHKWVEQPLRLIKDLLIKGPELDPSRLLPSSRSTQYKEKNLGER
jgi:hypothetical protein